VEGACLPAQTNPTRHLVNQHSLVALICLGTSEYDNWGKLPKTHRVNYGKSHREGPPLKRSLLNVYSLFPFSSQCPALPVFGLDIVHSGLAVADFELGRIPLQFVPGSIGDIA